MYLHLGNDVVVHKDEVIAIFDIDKTTVDQITRDYLKNAEENGEVVNVSEDIPKSFVVCKPNKDGKYVVYTSQLSSATLYKRASLDPEEVIK